MELTKDNIFVFAAKFYRNESCLSIEEFEEDLHQGSLAKKLARKISSEKSVNVRLLCNHIQCFTNNFELQCAKKILMLDASKKEKEVLKTILNYFGFLDIGEMPEISFCLETAKLLKDMDK